MNFLIGFVALFAVASAIDYNVCHDNVVQACSATANRDAITCNSILGGYMHAEKDLQSYVNSHLSTSYDYLLMATHFNSYQKNRPGFEKLYRKLSDKAWENAVGLIKKITQRGGTVDFNMKHEAPSTISQKQNKLEVDELHSLALALDSEKKLSSDAHQVHRHISRMDKAEHYDPDIAQYLEEKFLEYQSEMVRKLSGYANDVANLMKVADPGLNIYLFDEYLQKQ